MILENKIFAFIWDRGSWKTMLSSIFGEFENYKQVFSNFSLKYKNKKVIRYKDFELYKKLDFDDLSKKLLIFDEGGVNANSRSFASKINKLLSYFMFVSRKFNIDCVFITQDFETFDKNIRRQTNFLFEISNQLPFAINAEIWKMKNWQKTVFMWDYQIKALEIMELEKISYDTRDLTGFEDKIKEFLN